MKACITGITGFVGSHLAEYLLSAGHQVMGTSQRGMWHASIPTSVIEQTVVIRWDLGAPSTADTSSRIREFQPDVVFHLAAVSVPSDCGSDTPSPVAAAANIDGTRHVVDLMLAQSVRPRLVFASSCYVYGAVTPDSTIVSEETPCRSTSGYGRSKLAAEQLVSDAIKQMGLDAVVVRAFQHSGPRQSPRMILPDWAKQLCDPNVDTIRAICLDTLLDLTDVRDVVRAYDLLAQGGRSGATYNVGSGRAYRSGDLLDQMLALTGEAKPVVEVSPGRRYHPIANIQRIQTDTGWSPEIPMQKTLSDLLDFWKTQGDNR